jgi:cation:H+ antiporter
MFDPDPGRRRTRALTVRGLVLLHPLDVVIGTAVLLFFLSSALLSGGDVPRSLGGGLLIMLVMFVVGASIEAIIDSLRHVPGLGTTIGFITNGPEMLCLVVGLLAGDIKYAASTPLGSNFMNPLMLLSALLIVGAWAAFRRHHPGITLGTLGVTAVLAATFFVVPDGWYPAWLAVTVVVSALLFWRRPGDPADEAPGDGLPRWSVLPAAALLVAAGYWLDPVVTLTAEASHAPKGVIGFFVLAALTSWPEFRSCLGLLRRGRLTSAVLNITVSNITNLWLAGLGVAVYIALF